MRSAIAATRNEPANPRLARSRYLTLLRYSEEHRTLVVELAEAVRELSALVREMRLLLASQECEKHYQ